MGTGSVNTLLSRRNLHLGGEGGAFELFLLLFPPKANFGVEKDIQTETEDEETNETQFRLPPFFLFFAAADTPYFGVKEDRRAKQTPQQRAKGGISLEGKKYSVVGGIRKGGRGSCSL